MSAENADVTKNTSINVQKKMKSWPQILGTLTICISTISRGGLFAYPTKTLPQVQNTNLLNHTTTNNSEMKVVLNSFEGSLFAASIQLTGIFFAPFGGIISGWIGRRKTILLMSPFVSLGYLLIAVSQNKFMLLLGRFLSTTAMTLHVTSEAIYISETVHPMIRGTLLVVPNLFFCVGTLFIWVISYFFSWRTTAYFATIPPALLCICMIFLPETPYWLIENNNIEAARKSLQFYRGDKYDITEEIGEIQQKHVSKQQSQSSVTWTWTLKRLFSASFFKPFLCVGLLNILSKLSGSNVITYYMITILEESGSSIDPNIGPIIAGSIGVAAVFIPVLIVKRVPSRLLFGICQIISTLALLGFSVYCFLHTMVNQYNTNFGWIPLVTLITADLMQPLGISPVLDIIASELFPTEIRTQALGITRSSYYSFSAFATMIFPKLKEYLGLYGVFFCFSAMSTLCTFWGFIKIPETRGKSLIKVEEMMFEKNRKAK